MSESWYKEGLRFKCTQCGNCCTGSPGYVYVTKKEVDQIAAFIGREGKGLTRKHLRKVGRRYSLTEDKTNGDCCFLKQTENGKRVCGIYPVRPLQCRTWPFWQVNLESPDAWSFASQDCPGINKGKRHDFVQIEIRRTAKSWEDLSPCPSL
ncbi:MAG: YkgJ family cysteine cluster protein [Phycisphaerales bacterium]|nr:YkgJ family cysteine cluster protein [Phycisphaerales bacterium]